MLERIRIVLVRPSHAGNIGASARAMKTMGLEHLVLVAPQGFPSKVATDRASGASDVLQRAICCQTLSEAIDECHTVFGSTARVRELSWPQLNPHEMAEKIAQNSETKQVAIVFGTERSGLTNKELDLCQAMINIPANPEYCSLNLAAAVQIVCYEIALAALKPAGQGATEEIEPRAKQGDIQRFFQHLDQVLVDIEFLDKENPRLLERRLHRLFNRSGLLSSEVQILRGILTAIQRKLDPNT